MLVLTFHVGEELLALDIRRVEEVIPRVDLRQVIGAAPWIAGVFIYRGDVVPVIDLHQLAGAVPCPYHLSSRIILSKLRSPAGEVRIVGLLASRVDDTRDFEPRGTPLHGSSDAGTVDLGPVFSVENNALRFFDPDRFLSVNSWRQLFGMPREEVR